MVALTDQRQQARGAASLDREDADLALALQDAQHDDLARRAPAAPARPIATKHGFVAFEGARQRVAAVLVNGQHRANEPEVALEGRLRRGAAKPQPVDGHPQDEIFQHAPLGAFRQPEQVPHRRAAVSMMAAPTLEPAIAQAPGPAVAAVRTCASHS